MSKISGNCSAIAIAVALTLSAATQTAAQMAPPLAPAVADLARDLETQSVIADETHITPPAQRIDHSAPVNSLRSAQQSVRDLAAGADERTARLLNVAGETMAAAWSTFAAGSDDLTHLGGTTDLLQKAQAELTAALRAAPRDMKPSIVALQSSLSDVAARMAGDLLHAVQRAGVRPAALVPAARKFAAAQAAAKQGRWTLALGRFGGSLKLAANTVVFDVALFEQNIKDVLQGQTVGHAFSISYLGQLYQGGESAGAARTTADPPAVDQSPSKEMHVASVSKMLTAIVTLHLLQDLGLTPDTAVGPYLPSNWTLGAGVDQLTFRNFMTHTSGFGQKGAASAYAGLQAAAAQAVNGPTSCGNNNVGATGFCYNNGNFGMMRVLVSGLLGLDPADYAEFDSGALTAATFLIYAQQLYQSIGVEIDCAANDATPTVQYEFPDDGSAGYLEPSRQLSCGGFGWFISANEIAAVLTHLRQTQNLLSTNMRKTMQEGFLGFMDPANYGFIGGTYGVYSMHGGDWFHSNGDLHSCAVAFPIKVEVGLVINSALGPIPYQCAVLQSAFDNAWVAK